VTVTGWLLRGMSITVVVPPAAAAAVPVATPVRCNSSRRIASNELVVRNQQSEESGLRRNVTKCTMADMHAGQTQRLVPPAPQPGPPAAPLPLCCLQKLSFRLALSTMVLLVLACPALLLVTCSCHVASAAAWLTKDSSLHSAAQQRSDAPG
jgi:hypothetical protein